MTLAERAKYAADFLNAGEWRGRTVTPCGSSVQTPGEWHVYSRETPNHYYSHSQLIALAIAEGWQEPDAEIAPKRDILCLENRAETEQIPFFNQVIASPTVPFQIEFEDNEDEG